MNVTCEKCQRRYVVPDEKLQDRNLRLRCKNCQNVIEVALPPAPPGPAAAAANPWDEEPTRAAPKLDRTARWFAMVQGHQVGPLELPALEAKVRGGEITLKTYLWRDGLEAWRRAEELPELLPVFAAPKASAPVPPPPAPAPRPALHNLFDDEERTVVRPKKARAAPAPASAPAAAVQSAPAMAEEVSLSDDEDVAPAPRGKWKWIALAVMVAALGGAAALVVARG